MHAHPLVATNHSRLCVCSSARRWRVCALRIVGGRRFDGSGSAAVSTTTAAAATTTKPVRVPDGGGAAKPVVAFGLRAMNKKAAGRLLAGPTAALARSAPPPSALGAFAYGGADDGDDDGGSSSSSAPQAQQLQEVLRQQAHRAKVRASVCVCRVCVCACVRACVCVRSVGRSTDPRSGSDCVAAFDPRTVSGGVLKLRCERGCSVCALVCRCLRFASRTAGPLDGQAGEPRLICDGARAGKSVFRPVPRLPLLRKRQMQRGGCGLRVAPSRLIGGR